MKNLMKNYTTDQLENALDILRANHPESIINLWEDGLEVEKSELTEARLEKEFIEILEANN